MKIHTAQGNTVVKPESILWRAISPLSLQKRSLDWEGEKAMVTHWGSRENL